MGRGDARERLLAAATELFDERGYDRTTTRDLADRAGVDAALIARYFGSKAGLYLATLPADPAEATPDVLQPDRMSTLLQHLDQRGPGPVFRAAVEAHEDATVQSAAREAMLARLVTPLRDRFEQEGRDRPQLRAEVVAAAFAGVALGRSSGSFEQLAAAPVEELVDLLQELLASRLLRSGR